jgi:hypothetical protein
MSNVFPPSAFGSPLAGAGPFLVGGLLFGAATITAGALCRKRKRKRDDDEEGPPDGFEVVVDGAAVGPALEDVLDPAAVPRRSGWKDNRNLGRRVRQDYVGALKERLGCAACRRRCGVLDTSLLHCDHVDGRREGDEHVSNLVKDKRPFHVINTELEKVHVLCGACHSIRTERGGGVNIGPRVYSAQRAELCAVVERAVKRVKHYHTGRTWLRGPGVAGGIAAYDEFALNRDADAAMAAADIAALRAALEEDQRFCYYPGR